MVENTLLAVIQLLMALTVTISIVVLFWQKFYKQDENLSEKTYVDFILLIPYSLMLGFGYNCTTEKRFDIFFGFFAISISWE